MEKLTHLSKVKILDNCQIHRVPATVVGAREQFRVLLNSNSKETGRDTITFSVLPNLPSELHLRDCYLESWFKAYKDDAALPSTDQISMSNFCAATFFEQLKVFVNGVEALPGMYKY